MNTDWIIQRAYDLLSDAQPVPADCGQFCNKKCCSGSAKDGMLLFPGEEKRFVGAEGFEITDTPLGKQLSCQGTCDRSLRPIACRIFPLFPYVTGAKGNYKINVLKDIRAIDFCPLRSEDICVGFERSVRLAARNLLRDDACAEFLCKLTAEMTDMGCFDL